MRDFRLDPADVDDIASAYEALLDHPDVDPARSGLLGTCVGGAFALMGTSCPRIRDRVNFVLAYAAYASMWSLARDIASASQRRDGQRIAWAVDPLTRKVFVHTVTAFLEPAEAELLRGVCAGRHTAPELVGLSEAGRAVLPLLTALDPDQADIALQRLPRPMRRRLDAMSPVSYVPEIHAPQVVLLHDRTTW